MQFEVVFLLLFGFCYSAPHEGLPLLNPGGIGGIFKGPGSETIIIGPDGSEITSEEKGGVVIRDDTLFNQPIVVPEPEISVSAPILTEERIISNGPLIIASTGAPILASAAPILASPSPQLLTGETYDGAELDYIDAPLVAPAIRNEIPLATIDVKPIEIVEQDPHIIETEIIEAPDVEPEQSSDLEGPSGRIITKGSASIVSGPASTTITEPRKIIIAPPKIAIGTPVIASATIPINDASIVASLPTITGSTVAPLSAGSYESASTVAPPALSYSSTAAPIEWGYSTSAAPLASASSAVGLDSGQINLGLGGYNRDSIPVVEYSSSNGVLNGQNVAELNLISSTEAPVLSSTISTVTTDRYAPSEGPVVPRAYLVPPAAPTNLAPLELGSSIASANIQRIPRIEDNIAVDGRVDMGYSLYEKPSHQIYQLPQVLGMALSRFYQKNPVQDKETIVIDDKMGELSQNEITQYDSEASFLTPPDLSESRYIGPALTRNGIDASQVNLAQVPLSQVSGLPNGAYGSGIERGYLSNRYERNANKRDYGIRP